MAWNGSGTFTRTNGTNTGSGLWAADAASQTQITAANHDTHDEDIATALNACLTKNMETKPTAHFLSNADATYNLGSATVEWLNAHLSGDLVFGERADHSVAPAAGFGQVWVKSDTPATLFYTDDAGTDHQISNIISEGTWDPIITDGTNDATMGATGAYYQKVGNLVYIEGRIVVSSMGSVSGNCRVKGLPENVKNNVSQLGAVTVGQATNLNLTAGQSVSGRFAENTDYFFLTVWDASGGTTTMTNTQLNTVPDLFISGFYVTA